MCPEMRTGEFMRKEKLKEETKEGLCIGMVLSLFHKQVRSKGFITKVKFSTIDLILSDLMQMKNISLFCCGHFGVRMTFSDAIFSRLRITQ